MTDLLDRPSEPQPAVEAASPPRRKSRVRLLIPIALIILGIGVFVYPVVATLYNNAKQSAAARKYSTEVAEAPESDLVGDLQAASQYNRNLEGVPILDPWLTKVSRDPSSVAYKDYQAHLGRFSSMARLRAPSIGVDLAIYHGTSDDTLAKGVGHLYGTSLPVGGIGTHAVLTSHTALTTATLFDHLDEMKVDDVFFIDVYGETLAYQVDQIKIILPQEISDLTIVDGEDYVTLVTCTPYAVNTHRLLVRGHRIPVEVAETTPSVVAASPSVIQPWMYWLLAGAAAGVVALLVIALLAWRRRRRQRRLAPMATIEPTRASTTAPQ